MKLNTTDFRRKMQHPMLLALLSVPLLLILCLTTAPQVLPGAWLLPAAYVLLGWGCILLPGKTRLVGGMVSAAALIALSAALLMPKGEIILFFLLVIYLVLLIFTLPIGGWPRNQELHMGWHVGGVCTHVLLQFMINIARRGGVTTYEPGQTPLLVSFLCYAVLVLLALNRASLESAAQSRRTVPLLMRRQNIAVTLALLAIGVAVAAIPAIGSALSVAWDWLMKLIALIAAFLAALMPQKSGGGSGGGAPGDMDLGMGEASPPSQLAVIMEKVIGILALVTLAVALIFALRALAKKLGKLLRYLWGRLGQYGSAVSEDYEDEITSTRDESDVEREGLLSRLRRMAPAEEKGLTPTERVRSRYRRMKRRHDWGRASTARETLPEEAAILYERARYSGEALTEEEASRFHERTKKV